jgi:hypothetical protein
MINDFGAYSMPLLFRIGLAMDFTPFHNHLLTTAFDIVHPPDNFERYNLGMEYSILETLFIRAGFEMNRDETTTTIKLFKYELTKGALTAGCGLKYRMRDTVMKFDYAFADFGRLPDVHRISIGYAF